MYLPTYIYTYIHTYIPTYIPTYIHRLQEQKIGEFSDPQMYSPASILSDLYITIMKG